MVLGRIIKKVDKKEETIVEDVERLIEKLEDVLPINDEANALVETVRWLTLVEKTIEVTEKKMNLDEKLDAMAIIQFLTSREVEMLYRSSVHEIAETLVDAGEEPYNIIDRKLGKKIKSLAFLTGRRLDEVLDDIEGEMYKIKKKQERRGRK